ncbi:hypothetical protein [Mesorhizobium sp. 128a]
MRRRTAKSIGRWRVVQADLWDHGYLNLGPATISIKVDNSGEIAFGALQAGLDLSFSPTMVFFTWAGFGEMDGDEAIQRAKRDTSSTSCYSTARGLFFWRKRYDLYVSSPSNQPLGKRRLMRKSCRHFAGKHHEAR